MCNFRLRLPEIRRGGGYVQKGTTGRRQAPPRPNGLGNFLLNPLIVNKKTVLARCPPMHGKAIRAKR